MVTLNDFLYSGDTVIRILRKYESALRSDAAKSRSPVDMAHCNFLLQMAELLEHNDFLTGQSNRIREFYKFMSVRYPWLAFTFKGRIKSLIRSEEKFNGYITELISDRYRQTGRIPGAAEIRQHLTRFRDMIAYRIVIQVPVCHLRPGEAAAEVERTVLYDIADLLPEFLEQYGFTAELSGLPDNCCELLREDLRPYFRDYVEHPKASGYRSLHITFFDNTARCHTEVQLRTKEMDDYAEIGAGNHQGYEQTQAQERTQTDLIPPGLCSFYDDALQRGRLLQSLDLSAVKVNMFTALSSTLMNDGCGLYRGRLILPFEHLSRYQNELLD